MTWRDEQEVACEQWESMNKENNDNVSFEISINKNVAVVSK